MRWTDESGTSEIELDGRRGLAVVPADAHGAERASLLLEALDRAATGGQRRIQINRRSVRLDLELPAGWPPASHVPSVVLGGGARLAALKQRDAASDAAEATLGERLRALGEPARALLLGFPTLRRRVAAQRRRVEAELVRCGDAIRSRRRLGGAIIVAAIIALVAAVAGAAVLHLGLLLAAAVSFFALAAALLWETATRRVLDERRAALEVGLGRIADREHRLDGSARASARQLGYSDPWEASAHIRRLDPRDEIPAPAPEDRAATIDLAKRLLRASGQAESSLDWNAGFDAVRSAGPRGWPPEASSGCGELLGPANVLRLAALIRRVEGRLDPAWPIVFHDPWPDQDPHDRARLLLAVSEICRPRPVVAIIEPVVE